MKAEWESGSMLESDPLAADETESNDVEQEKELGILVAPDPLEVIG